MMKLTFINVGYGEAILVECFDAASPGQTFTMLIDGGSAEAAEYAHNTTGRTPTARFLKERGIDHIDWMVSSHIHEDHLCGLLPVAQQIPVRQFWKNLPTEFWKQVPHLSPSLASTTSLKKQISAINDYRSLCSCLEAQGSKISFLFASEQVYSPCQNLTLRVLAPSRMQVDQLEKLFLAVCHATEEEARRSALAVLDSAMNNYSLVLLLEYEGVRILLPGDTNRDGYAGIEEDIGAHIFKVGHHSQLDGISPALFDRIRPTHVVSCASSDRRFGSAHPEILQMMHNKGAKLFFSDCPDVPPYTDGLLPHQAVEFTIADGCITSRYLVCQPAT
jgi:beta-lactamase superfamily II metal-dependent hydrolase